MESVKEISERKGAVTEGNSLFCQRRRWDSNPCAREGKTISSRSRYDHFDTSPQHIPFYQNKVICQ